MAKDKQKEKAPSFGELLRQYRHKAFDKDSREPMSQGQLALKLYDQAGLIIDRNKVGKWETGRILIPATERKTLNAIISVLLKFRGITSLDDANLLLKAGGYKALDIDEINKINPDWMPARKEISLQDEKSPAQDVAAAGLEALRDITFNIKANEPLPITLRIPKFGPGSAPPPPSLIIGREDDLRNLKENLGISGKSKTTIQILTAIKGWPGVGKTTIASALAQDEDIRKAFPDGILWTSLGQEPNLLSEIAAWGRALGTDELLRARTLEEAQAQLTALLRNKKMLLIIDDVWEPEHAKPFTVGGQNCAMLITTRRDDVANALAPSANSIYRLKVLKEEDALTLLKELAPTVVEGYPKESLVLVQGLEGLPLALQVAGRLLNAEANRGFGVVELINDIKKGAKLLEAEAPADRTDLVNETTPTIAALLQKSLDLLDEKTRDCYAYLGVFAPKPATFDLEAMKFVWQVEDAKPVVKILVDYGLLEFVPEMERYQMHALLVMLAKTLLTDDESKSDED